MKLSLQATMVMGFIFSMACIAVAINGFTSIPAGADPAAVADARGFAFFWAFLGLVGFAFAAASWGILRAAAGGAGKDE
jgi:hypothetical protein